QVLRSADEVAGGVVDEPGQRPAVGPDLGDHLVDGLGDADVAADADDLLARRVADALGGLLDHAGAAAADVDGRAQLRIGLGHDLAQARAAAGHQNALALE